MEGTSFPRGVEVHFPLHVATAGSVDDGKSTLIGRLLYDSELLTDDQVNALQKKAVLSADDKPDFAAITDGLTDERAQGIIIDVAYRYVDTPGGRIVIADVPGHEQYTRNMVTGASNADVVIILTDVQRGTTTQTWRHLCIALMLGIPHIIIAVNKMDLVGYDAARFDAIADEVRRRAAPFPATQLHFLPVSAHEGCNVVHKAAAMPWYEGSTLIDILQSLAVDNAVTTGPFRFPVQNILRPSGQRQISRRGYLGRITSGSIATGDQVVIFPGSRPARVTAIERLGEPVDSAVSSQSVLLYLDREIDVARGDVIACELDPPTAQSTFNAVLFWLGQTVFDPARRYQVQHASRSVGARILALEAGVDVTGPVRTPPPEKLMENDIAVVRLLLQSPLAADNYRKNRKNGTFVLVDEQTNETVATGLIGEDTFPAGA